MAYLVIEDFRIGLDRRRDRLAGTPGSLWDLVNCHITRGGDIERRKRFVKAYDLPAGTFGLQPVGDALYVFGSAVDPGVPLGVSYQRLQHPDGAPRSMTALLDSELFDGKVYAIAEFDDGSIHHYYDGVTVADWDDGRARSAMTDSTGIAAHLNGLLQADPDVTSSAAAGVITLTGNSDGDPFTVSAEAVNVTGGTDDQTAAVAQTQAPVASVAETLAQGSFSITAGAPNTAASGTFEVTATPGGGEEVTSITVGGVEVLGATVSGPSSDTTFAADLAAQINNYTSSPEYTASANGTVVTITAPLAEGADANGRVIAIAESVPLTGNKTAFTGGVTNAVTSVKVDGIEMLGDRVNWSASNSQTALLLQSEINSTAASPDYDASVSGPKLILKGQTGTGATPNGKTVAVTTVGAVTVGSIAHMAGGVDKINGVAQVSTVAIGGTFEPGDAFTVTVNGRTYGAKNKPGLKGRTALTFKSKLYSSASSILYYCGVNDPTVWDSANDSVPGAGFVNFANQDAGSSAITAIAKYQGNLAVFSRGAVQIEFVEADDVANTLIQTLDNTGTRAPGSVQSVGNLDTFYLDDTGIRSLRARDSSNTAFANDVGTAIDPLVQEFMASLTDAEIEAARSVVEPVDGRYWLALGQRIFVFSFFSGSKISAWSYYDVTDDIGAAIDALKRAGRQVYARAGDAVYLYGGSAGNTYPGADEVVATVEMPFLSANRPGTFKGWTAVDIGARGVWEVDLLYNPNDDTVFEQIATITDATYGMQMRFGAFARATHVAPKLICRRAGPASIANVVLHFEQQEDS